MINIKDKDYMVKAIALALEAKGKTSPNPIVGAVIVKGNKIIATGFHRCCGEDHAEIVALKKAGVKAKGATLYVTLEPCFHYGRTPPCVDTIINSGIKEVVIGMKDPNPKTNGKSIAKLRKAGIKVKVGVLEKEVAVINEPFIKYIKTKMPFVVAKCAQSLDGKIATASGESKWITNKATRNYTRRLRNEFDAIMVGINTILQDNPCLCAPNKEIKKIVVDSTLEILLTAKIFKKTQARNVFIATTKKATQTKIANLEAKGANVIVCPTVEGKVDLKWLFKNLAKQEITSVLIEGGANVIGSALKANSVDKMHIYIAPKIFGDKNALPSVVGFKVQDVNKIITLKDISVALIGPDIKVEGYVLRHS